MKYLAKQILKKTIANLQFSLGQSLVNGYFMDGQWTVHGYFTYTSPILHV